MLHLSRLYPNVRSKAVRRDLANAYELHRTLMRAFPERRQGGPGRVLFRVDTERETQQPYVLVQSDTTPTWSRLPEDELGRPYTVCPPEWKTFEPTFAAGQLLRFRLRANPVVKRKPAGANEGKRLGLFREEDQITWLVRKGNQAGFVLRNVLVIKEGFQSSRKNNHAITHWAVRFEGVLEVSDPDRLLQSLAEGIGPAKAFGFGLLSLARI
ncbi:MAG: type I-E CRISPR-associated protein Cas6/Cse3/CasE [Planctomycetes bacterium]|nr:type I-E CRISPR-associated protein Cas6/Cse3/CasE [Planctomycetota bacterium]